jgi:hypothetical protein
MATADSNIPLELAAELSLQVEAQSRKNRPLECFVLLCVQWRDSFAGIWVRPQMMPHFQVRPLKINLKALLILRNNRRRCTYGIVKTRFNLLGKRSI